MKYKILVLSLFAATTLAACASPAPNTSNTGKGAATSTIPPDTSPQSARTTSATSPNNTPPVAPAHRGAAIPLASTAPNQSIPDTSALDTEIMEAEKKAQVKGATIADKKAVAAAYLTRGNVFYAAGQPRLYKFALGDFRRALRYEPNNEEARVKMEQIVSIYQSMNRPVPDNGTEP